MFVPLPSRSIARQLSQKQEEKEPSHKVSQDCLILQTLQAIRFLYDLFFSLMTDPIYLFLFFEISDS